jgi:hypothetical protein
MVELDLKLIKGNNRFMFAIPKALIDAGILRLDKKKYSVIIKDERNNNKLEELQEEMNTLKQRLENIQPSHRDLNPGLRIESPK